MSDPWQKFHVSFRITAYIVNLFPVTGAFWCVLKIYKNIIRKSDKIRQKFLGNNKQMKEGIQEIQDWSYSIFVLIHF
jgi:hypothetical protein